MWIDGSVREGINLIHTSLLGVISFIFKNMIVRNAHGTRAKWFLMIRSSAYEIQSNYNLGIFIWEVKAGMGKWMGEIYRTIFLKFLLF